MKIVAPPETGHNNPFPPRIKICGITRPEDAADAVRLGIDFIGLNFFSGSKRWVPLERAKAIAAALPGNVEAVALFVNEPLANAQETARQAGIKTLQVYGEHRETPSPSTRLVPAFPVKDAGSLAIITNYVELLKRRGAAPLAVLVDAHVAGQYGGTGQKVPWHMLAGFDPGVPLILAGGLTPENVAEAIRIVRPWAVDVSSGVEKMPGIKDPEKMKRFVEAVRSA